MQASVAGMTTGSNSRTATKEHTKTAKIQRWNRFLKQKASFENENCLLGSQESLEVRGKMKQKNH